MAEADNRKEEENNRKRQDSANRLKDTWQAINQEIFGVSGAAFWEQTERSAEQMAALAEKARETQENLALVKYEWARELKADMGGVANESFTFLSNMGFVGESFENLTGEQIRNLQDAFQDIGNDDLQLIIDQFGTIEDKYNILNQLSEDNADTLAGMSDEYRNQLMSLSSALGIHEDTVALNQQVVTTQRQLNQEIDNANQKYSKGLNLVEGFYEISDNMRKLAIKTAFEWDKVANSVQRESGIMLSNLGEGEGMLGNFSTRAADLTSNMAQFGMSLEDIGKFVGEIGEELHTTGIDTVNIAKQFAAISMATGVSTKEVAELGGNLLKMGRSVEEVSIYFEDANNQARTLGVNSRKVLQAINKNLTKMQSFGFTQGEKSLTKMAARAEQLRIEIDEIFDVAERARTIEGAMDMAAQLQLAGGSFSNIDPGSLLAAARQGPDELQKILSRMGGDIGNFNNGEFQIDPIDGDRLRIVAEATGMKYESLFEIIRRNAVDAKKVGDTFSDSFFENAAKGIDGMDGAMMKSSFSDLLAIGKDGEISLTTDGESLLNKAGITDWKSMTDGDLKSIMEARSQEALSLEDQARENMDMRKSMDSLVNSITNTMTVFQPIMEMVAGWINTLNTKAPTWVKGVVGALIGIGSIVGPMIARGMSIAIASKFGGNVGGGLTGLAGGIRGAAKAIGETSMKNVLKFGAALGIIGISIVGFSAAMAAWGGEASLAQMGTAAGSLVLLAGGVYMFSQVAGKISLKDVGIATLAMLGVAVGVGAFGLAAQQMNGVDWGSVLAGLGVMALSLAAMIGLGALMLTPAGVLAALGLAGMVVMALGIAAVGALLASAAGNFGKLAGVDWSGFGEMGTALMKAAPGIAMFGLSAMAFANPIAMLGMLAMIGSLGILGVIMNPLAENMEKAATSMEKLVDSMTKLKSVVKELDTGKLEEISEMAENMSKASRNNAIASLASSIKEMFSGSGSSGGGGSDKPREIKIRLYLPNGRELQHQILEDTAVQSGR